VAKYTSYIYILHKNNILLDNWAILNKGAASWEIKSLK